MLITLLTAAAALAGPSPKSVGCPAALEFFRRYTALELRPDQFALFSPSAVIRLYGETADGQDLGHKDLNLGEYRALPGPGLESRYSRIRCELDGANWLVTAQRHAIRGSYVAPVSLVIGHQNGQLRILSAAYVQIAD